jgi:hypothetical protein
MQYGLLFETGNDQLKTHLRGPGRVLRSHRSRGMVRREIYGFLLTHHAISALICQAATEADIDPDRVKFTRTVRIVRRAGCPAAFPLTRGTTSARRSWRHHQEQNLNSARRHRTYPRVVKRAPIPLSRPGWRERASRTAETVRD